MTKPRFRPAVMALLAAAMSAGLLLGTARADNAPTPAEMQQQMRAMHEQMQAMQGQMLQMQQWMQQMMGRGMMGPGGYGMMGPGMIGPGPGYGMMGQGGPGYGMMGPGMMSPGAGYGMMDPDDMPGYGMMGQGGPGYGMMGQGGQSYGAMGALTGNPDRDFVLVMQQHHRSERAMAASILAETKDPDVKKLAESIEAGAEKDLAELQDWLDKHP
jgi:uncharacterized protein (DUF305 family)